jgi:signal transduction histidine kinase
MTDGERLRVALVNLLVNARQAIESQAALTTVTAVAVGGARPVVASASHVVVLSTRSAADRAVITISDNGPGIERADLPRVFDPYFTTKRGGTGLGLPIARNILEGLGGTMTISSSPGRGTEVRIEIPYQPSAPGPSKPDRLAQTAALS